MPIATPEVDTIAPKREAWRELEARALVMRIIKENPAGDWVAVRLELKELLKDPDNEDAYDAVVGHFVHVVRLSMANAASAETDREARKAKALEAQGGHQPSDARAERAERLFLSRVVIDGKPIGECTAGRVRTWARQHGVEARFAHLLTEGMTNEMIVGEKVTEAEAAKIWKLAEKQS